MKKINTDNNKQFKPHRLILNDEDYLVFKMTRLKESICKWERELELLELDDLSAIDLVNKLDNCNKSLTEVIEKLDKQDFSLSAPFD